MELFLTLLLSFFAARGFRYHITNEGLVMRNTESFLWLILMLFFAWVIRQSFRSKDKRLIGFSALFGIIIASFYILGISMEKMQQISWIWSSPGSLAAVLNLFYSQAALYFCFAFLSFDFLAKRGRAEHPQAQNVFSLKRVFLFWIILILLYLPWYLYCFPGNITQDSADQLDDAITVEAIRDHHSAFLTLMMRIVIIPIRALTGSLQSGVGAVSLLQVLIVTFVFAFTYEWLRQYLRSRILRIICFLWFACYPVHYFYAVTLWKDILFSIGFLAFLVCIDAAAADEAGFFSCRRNPVILTLLMVLLPLMRHNGISIVAVMAFCLLLRFPAHRRQTLRILAGFVLLFGIWKLAVLPALNVTEITSSHVFSVLEQQMARAMNVHHEELSAEEMSEFCTYFDIEDLWDRYNPILSDSVKKHFRNDLFEKDPMGFFSGWLKLGRRYPADYIEAFLANNYGYWFPETHYGFISYGVNEMGEIEDVHSAPILRSGALTAVYNYLDQDQYLKTPLVPLIFSRGACFWLWVFCGCYCLYNNRRKFILFIPGLSLWLGILISPVYNEYRYVYGLFAALPLLLASTLNGSDGNFPDRPTDIGE